MSETNQEYIVLSGARKTILRTYPAHSQAEDHDLHRSIRIRQIVDCLRYDRRRIHASAE